MYDETRAAQHALVPAFWLVLKPRRKYGVSSTHRVSSPRVCCCSGSFHSEAGASKSESRAAATVACGCVHVHARVSSCVPDAAPLDIG